MAVRTYITVDVEGKESNVQIESFDCSLNRGLTVNTATFTLLKKKGDSLLWGIGDDILAKVVKEEAGQAQEIPFFKGKIIQIKKKKSMESLTHYFYEVTVEDAVAELEGTEVSIDVYDEAGVSVNVTAPWTGLLYKTIRTDPPTTIDLYFQGGGCGDIFRRYTYQGNAIGHWKKLIAELGGSQYGGPGVLITFNPESTTLPLEFDPDKSFIATGKNIEVIEDTETIPEVNGVKLQYTIASVIEASGIISNVFFTKSQQWWIPAAWLDSNGNLHVLYITYLKHPDAPLSEADSNVYSALYFGNTAQTFTEMGLSTLTDSYDYTSLGEITLVKPTNENIYSLLVIHKQYTVSGSDTNLGPYLLSRFLEEMPEVITLHISSSKIWEEGEHIVGSEPYKNITMDVWSETAASNLALAELSEAKATDSTVYRYEFAINPILPIPQHMTDSVGEEAIFLSGKPGYASYYYRDSENRRYFIQQTNIRYERDSGVEIITTVRKESLNSAAFARVSQFHIGEYMGNSLKNKLNKLKNATYVYLSNGFIIFHLPDGSEVKLPQSQFILDENGVVRW